MPTLLLRTSRRVQCVAKLGERFPAEVHSYYNVRKTKYSKSNQLGKYKLLFRFTMHHHLCACKNYD